MALKRCLASAVIRKKCACKTHAPAKLFRILTQFSFFNLLLNWYKVRKLSILREHERAKRQHCEDVFLHSEQVERFEFEYYIKET